MLPGANAMPKKIAVPQREIALLARPAVTEALAVIGQTRRIVMTRATLLDLAGGPERRRRDRRGKSRGGETIFRPSSRCRRKI